MFCCKLRFWGVWLPTAGHRSSVSILLTHACSQKVLWNVAVNKPKRPQGISGRGNHRHTHCLPQAPNLSWPHSFLSVWSPVTLARFSMQCWLSRQTQNCSSWHKLWRCKNLIPVVCLPHPHSYICPVLVFSSVQCVWKDLMYLLGRIVERWTKRRC